MAIRLMVVLLILSVASVSAQASSQAYTVAVSKNASDVLWVEDGELAGIAAPLYQCVFDRTGLEFTFVNMPLSRALFNFEHGEVAVALPLAKTIERDRHGVFAGSLIDVQYLLLSLEALPSMEAIEGMLYVLPRGHLGKQFIEDFVPGGFEVNSWEQVFSMLRLGRADLTVVPQLILEDILEGAELPFHTLPAGSVPSSLYISDAYVDTRLDEELMASVAFCREAFAEDIQQKQRRAGSPVQTTEQP